MYRHLSYKSAAIFFATALLFSAPISVQKLHRAKNGIKTATRNTR